MKLTGDGTRLGKHLHVVNLAFTILMATPTYSPSKSILMNTIGYKKTMFLVEIHLCC